MGRKALTWAMTIFMNPAILPQLSPMQVVHGMHGMLPWFRLMGFLPRVTQIQVPDDALQSLLLFYKLQALLQSYAGRMNTKTYASDPAHCSSSSHGIYSSGQRKKINLFAIPYRSSYFQNMSPPSWLHHVLPFALNHSTQPWFQLPHFLDQMRAKRKVSVLVVIRKII